MLRFAPSPTGDMHIGNLRVAILNYIISKQKNEDLIIRIEDTDKKRNITNKDKEILKILNLFSIDYKSISYQSDNIKYHTQMAMKLLLDKKAFNCFCSDEALELDRLKAEKEGKPYRYTDFCANLSDETKVQCNAPFVVRIKRPQNNIQFTDTIKGKFDFDPFNIDSFVILRQDKTPTYNFACAIDDMICDITTVIRGEDHLSNTPKQIHIRDALEYTKQIKYIHLPMILDIQTGKKMSKRDKASSVHWLIDEGYLPSAIANYLVLLGYNPPIEIFSIEEAIEWFDINKLSKSTAKFDIQKLNYVNREHINLLDNLRLSKLIGYSDQDIGLLAKLYVKECDTIKQIKFKIDKIFNTKDVLEEYSEEINAIKSCIKSMNFINDFNQFKKEVSKQTNLKGKKLFMPLRYVLTGSLSGPNINEIYPMIKNYLGVIV